MPNSRYFKALSERGRKMANARWKRYREEIDRKITSGELLPREPDRLPAGELLGVLQWHSRDGTIHRWTVRQAERKNQIQIDGCRKDHGWAWLLEKLREKLARLTR